MDAMPAVDGIRAVLLFKLLWITRHQYQTETCGNDTQVPSRFFVQQTILHLNHYPQTTLAPPGL